MSMYMDRLQLLRHDMFVLFVLMDCGWHLVATFFKKTTLMNSGRALCKVTL